MSDSFLLHDGCMLSCVAQGLLKPKQCVPKVFLFFFLFRILIGRLFLPELSLGFQPVWRWGYILEFIVG